MGAAGRRLLESHFQWFTIAAKMEPVYEWMLRGGALPECIEQARK